jgi:anti-sigma regulatory factor (Ser/Thr protein kinase)
VLALEPLAVSGDAGAFRDRLAAAMIARAVPQSGVVNMLIASTEVFDNAAEHGGGPTWGRAGLVDGRFVCEISDSGPGLEDPIAGYYPPGSDRSPGTGLWVARQLVFRVEVLPSAPGTTVRLWL